MLASSLLSSFLLAAFAAVPTDPGPVLQRAIPLAGVDGRLDHLACDPRGGRLYVAARRNGSIEVIDLGKGERVASITGLAKPQGLVLVPALGQLVVTCGGDGAVRAFDASTLEEKGAASVGPDADNIRLSEDGAMLVIGHGDGALALLDAATLETKADIRLGGHPESFQLEPATSRVFVNVPGSPAGAAVTVVDRAAQQVTAVWPLAAAGGNFPMALDAQHGRLYVACRRPARLVVLDAASGKVLASTRCTGDADDVFLDEATGRVLIVAGDGHIDVFETRDQTSYERVAAVPTALGARTGLLVPERRVLFVAVPARSGVPAEIREYALPQPPPPGAADAS